MKKTVAVALLLIMLVSLCACSSPEKAIIGTWKNQSTGLLGVVTETSYTFKDDGTGTKSSTLDYTFNYTITDEQLVITYSVLGVETTETYTFEIKSDKLSLTQDGTTVVYEKAE